MDTRHDTPELRKERGAFFTPPAIADFLAASAIGSNPEAQVLDPAAGDGVFLVSAGDWLLRQGADPRQLVEQMHGIDIHQGSLDEAAANLAEESLEAHLLHSDFFEVASLDQLTCPLPAMDAVIGNPPFIRYQVHSGDTRRNAAAAALRQGVRLSGLASSWAPLLVHASSFLKPDGMLAMVLPAELLQVHYAEPIRRWLRRRFASVHLVVFEQLQFADALENVVLLLAKGRGGCDAFSIYFAEDAEDLATINVFDEFAVTPAMEGKWTDLLLPIQQRQVFRSVTEEHFSSLEDYGAVGLGTVTGANGFFAISEATREEYGLTEDHLLPISPPGTKHFRGPTFTCTQWKKLRDNGERVWLLRPDSGDTSEGLARYVRQGEELGVHEAYKCRIRDPWWRPPAVDAPDLFFTYMSHRFPRLISNTAGVSFLNSMHGVWLDSEAKDWVRSALSLLTLNSVTMLGAEVYGRSYGGGILKLEPREAARLPVSGVETLEKAWTALGPHRTALERGLCSGRWTTVLAQVDRVLLKDTLGLSESQIEELQTGARTLRERRLNRKTGHGDSE